MKRFKLGFLAVIAILAMSFTVAENTGVMEKIAKAPSALGDCYTNFVIGGTTITQDLDCSLAPAVGSCVANSPFAVLVTNAVNPKAVGQPCAGSNTKFCCAKININGTCALTTISAISPIPQRYVLTDVYCKPQ